MRDIKDISHFYFIGIGGIGMSSLARYLKSLGKNVAGYDRVITSLTKKLEDEGIDIHYNDAFERIPDAFKDIEKSQVIYTPAVPQDFGELLRFRESGIPINKRAQLLGSISKTMTCLAVAGTHGKTTTSAILAHLLYKSDVKVTAFLGGILEEYETNYLSTGTDVMVVEADEFDRSFLQLSPDISGITSMDADHLDIYKTVEDFEQAFHEFADLVDRNKLFVNESLDIDNAQTVGIASGDTYVENLTIVNGAYHFDLISNGKTYADFMLKLPGQHNLSNALLALSMAIEYGVEPQLLKTALASFPGVKRRFSYKIDSLDRVVIDDYAHHPQEINAVYQAVSEMYPDEMCTVIFQPHLFSRTRDFMDEFAASLAQFDKVGILDIYPAREQPIDGVHSQALCENIRSLGAPPQVSAVVGKEDIAEFIEEMNNRIVLILGAGDIGVEAEKLQEKLAV
ncbi:UDP-N-acetylmuramate--L-alanine ligase [Nonlabens ponticola]|uniref:UDP-N-acetylmuramate--L-alanine ligase n=1 Tax=Nonlabens ponticola TaxID=2496866 RepID=A0A3S9N0Y3_9FLAO|nr:UDP-N-acetylmuramate--L-alanine ligase [Nonlabens ponticola]AZQ45080.1 UDP-N-acetylmuramate--L-alanine ligase [Nonlabens ponticola]